MLTKHVLAHVAISPVALSDKELSSAESFTIQTFDMCTVCGARFWIGYFGISGSDERDLIKMEEWPKKLTEMLAKDHWHNREHKALIDIDV